jgi:hypothetical protein
MRASGLSVSMGVNSSDWPSSAAISSLPILTRSSVLKRSRGTNTWAEVKRPNGSRRRNTGCAGAPAGAECRWRGRSAWRCRSGTARRAGRHPEWTAAIWRHGCRHHAGRGHHLRRTRRAPAESRPPRGVGGGGVQAQEAGSPTTWPRVKTLDGHIVQPGRAVHGGAGHGLGDQHQFVGLQQGHGFGWQLSPGSAPGPRKMPRPSLGFGHQLHHVCRRVCRS